MLATISSSIDINERVDSIILCILFHATRSIAPFFAVCLVQAILLCCLLVAFANTYKTGLEYGIK